MSTPSGNERRLWAIVLLALLVWSARGTGFDPVTLFGSEGRGQVGRFVAGLFPPELSLGYLSGLTQPVIETLQMSLLGVAFGALIAVPLGYVGTRTLAEAEAVPSVLGRRLALMLYRMARGALDLMRTVPDLVWALMFIAAVGLGPFSGVLALTVHSAGLLGKLYSEALESVDRVPVEALKATGASRFAILLFSVLPQARGPLVSVTLYQWECNIRSAMVLGFVGAGGLGQRIDIAMRLFRYDEMLTLLGVLLLLVTAVDRLSALMRRRLMLEA